jgi:hypothetical protein
MRAALSIVFGVAVLLQGCALHDGRAYTITQSTRKDAVKVRAILRDIAERAGLPPSPRSSGYQLSSHELSNVSLYATFDSSPIYVYLDRTDWPPPRAFSKADRLLAPALSTAFGQRFGVPKEQMRVIIY